ncbi:uncharacterized protein LOC136089761 [Hydra vulgaris]|uniref:Uncharacterized protein LOC136089761 n=1 Tax=Hydra vulgaris TaxID=6087 RepID=A0ABM4DC07_HYDVU
MKYAFTLSTGVDAMMVIMLVCSPSPSPSEKVKTISNEIVQLQTDKIDHLVSSDSSAHQNESNPQNDSCSNDLEQHIVRSDLLTCGNDSTIEKDSHSTNPGKWGNFNKDGVNFWFNRGPQECQNHSGPFECSRRFYNTEFKTLYYSESTFYGKKQNYWKEVLKQLIPVILTLSEQAYLFRGTNEHFGVPDNGNYLGLLELLAQFDPLLKYHIATYADNGKGNPSNLSKTICEELNNIMGEKVRSHIMQEILVVLYFSISADSTPEIAHIYQLSIVVRYVSPKNGKPVERFLTFLIMKSRVGAVIAEQKLCPAAYSKCIKYPGANSDNKKITNV